MILNVHCSDVSKPDLTLTEQCPNPTHSRPPLKYLSEPSPSGSKTVPPKVTNADTLYNIHTARQQKTFIYAEQTGIILHSCKQLLNLVFKQYPVDIVVNWLQPLSGSISTKCRSLVSSFRLALFSEMIDSAVLLSYRLTSISNAYPKHWWSPRSCLHWIYWMWCKMHRNNKSSIFLVNVPTKVQQARKGPSSTACVKGDFLSCGPWTVFLLLDCRHGW